MSLGELKKLGLGKSEAKAYLALLELGPTTTGPLMRKARISSSKIYLVLEGLIEKGLVSFALKEKTRHYRAAKPSALLDYLARREEELQERKKEALSLISRLPVTHGVGERAQEAQLYLGWKGVMSAFTQSLEGLGRGDEYLAFSQTRGEEESPDIRRFFARYQRRREERGLKVRIIAQELQRPAFAARMYKGFKGFEVRFVPVCPPGIIILKESVLITAFGSEPVAVIVSSRRIADSYRDYFSAAWKTARPQRQP